MMNWFTRKITGPINFYSMYNGARCMNDYTSYKIDIEREIDNFEKNTSGNYYKAWEKLNKYITEKNNSLKECYRNRHIGVTLIEDDKIKNFMNRCSSNRRCNNPSRQALRTPSSNPETKRSCKGPNDCKETAKPKEAKHQTKPTAAVVASKTRSSSRQNSDDQAHSHAAVTGSKTESVNLEKQTSIGQSVPSVKADTEAPEQRDNTQSGVSGQTETPTQSALDSAVEKENVVDPNLSNASSQGISDGGSPSIGNFPLKVLETNKHQGGPHGSKDLSGTALGEHATPVESVEVKTTRDNNCSKTSCAENPTEGTPSSGENCDGHSTQQVTNSVGTDETSVVPRDSVSVDFTTAGPVDLSIDRSSASKGVTNHVTLGSQNTCDDNSCVVDGQGKAVGDKPTDTETLDIDVAVEGPRSEEDVSLQALQKEKDGPNVQKQGLKEKEHESNLQVKLEIVDHLPPIRASQNQKGSSPSPQGLVVSHESNSATSTPIDDDLLKKIKSYIIMILVPLAIFLLLILLIKCTPLGTLFTKKKEKKRKQMNEKLQRVLVEPSNAREERNIQFAYSAFEYS